MPVPQRPRPTRNHRLAPPPPWPGFTGLPRWKLALLAKVAGATVALAAAGDVLMATTGLVPRAFLPGPGIEAPATVPRGNIHLLPRGLSDDAYDGAYAGRYGVSYDAARTHWEDVWPVVPSEGIVRTGKTVVYVNGAWTSRDGVDAEMQMLADATGDNVVGVVNSSRGWAPHNVAHDALQSVGDKLGIGENRAKDTVTSLLLGSVRGRRQVSLVGQSQGAASIGWSLHEVDAALARDQGPSLDLGAAARDRQEKLSVISVQTLGGAGGVFPDGPRYHHLVNTNDPVVRTLGVGNDVARAVHVVRPGNGAVITQFSSPGVVEMGPVLGPHVLPAYVDHAKKVDG